MRWSDIPWNPKKQTLRQFAVCLLVFGLLSSVFIHPSSFILHPSAVAIVLGLLGLIWPNLLRPLFVGWMVAVFPLAWLVSAVVLMLMYFGIITPMALTFRLFGRDALNRRFEPDRASYWEDRPQAESVDRYFRQY